MKENNTETTAYTSHPETEDLLIFDGDIRGHYIGAAVIGFAKIMGWEGEVASADSEDYHEAVDEAIYYLNTSENVIDRPWTTENGVFYFEDGSFFYSR